VGANGNMPGCWLEDSALLRDRAFGEPRRDCMLFFCRAERNSGCKGVESSVGAENPGIPELSPVGGSVTEAPRINVAIMIAVFIPIASCFPDFRRNQSQKYFSFPIRILHL
jgi:hypothetical protein